MSTTPPEPPAPGSHYQPSMGVVLVILVVFVAAAFLMLRSSKPGSATSGANTTTTLATTPGSSAKKSTTPTTVAKAQVRVQVANGTTVTGLARGFTQQLLTFGWDTLPQLNGPQVSATVIYFNPGFQAAARTIASELKFSASSVRPLNGASPVSGASSDDVIVLLGLNAAVTG